MSGRWRRWWATGLAIVAVGLMPAATGAETPPQREASRGASPADEPPLAPSPGASAAPAAPPDAAETTEGSPPALAPSRVEACVSGATPTDGVRLPHHWDPRSGYGLCQSICDQDQACVDARCVVRCVPGCREGTYCTADGECSPIPKGHSQQPTEAELQGRLGSSSAEATHAAIIDVGGVLFMGARPTYEWGRTHSLHVRLTLMNTGMMPYFLEPQSAGERFEWGFGTSFGYRRYEAAWGNLRGFYWGAGLDYAVTEVRDPFEQMVATVTHYGSGYAEFGYRWVFGDFLFGFGPALAVKVPFLVDQRPLASGGCLEGAGCPRDTTARVEGTMVVEVGWLE